MPIGPKIVKVPMGLREAWWIPISSEAADAHPTYGTPLQIGGNVKAALSVNTASGSVYSDDVEQLRFEAWISAQLDAETSCDDLEIVATLFGHTYSAQNGEESKSDDVTPNGAYAFIQDIILKDKSHVYRTTFLYKTSPLASSEALDAATRNNNFDPKMMPISLAVLQDNTGAWRARQEFATLAAAQAWINTKAGYVPPTT